MTKAASARVNGGHRNGGERARVTAAAIVTLAIIGGAPAVARAQVTQAPKAEVVPDPAKFAYGLYTEGQLGGVAMFGSAGEHVRPGFGLGLVVGYDILRFLAIEVRGVGSTHAVSFPAAPTDGEVMQLYQALVALKVNIHYRQLVFSVAGAGGFVRTSTNVLMAAGLANARNSAAAGGGLGFDYHPLSRHFSFGVRADYLQAFAIASSGELVATTSVRYVF